ncbi:MAG: hypothetical protein J0M12_16755 [Deltaproteobacteria bacterium]|nr:hypothetical protein [Deltaproteobacteria bacterium]
MPAVQNISISTPVVLVVEGVRDSAAVHRSIECTTIETRGMDVEGALPDIRAALIEGAVVVLTDSDPAGERIRNYIHAEVPGCIDARVEPKNGRQYARVESSSDAQILAALRKAGVEVTYHLPILNPIAK